LKKPEVRSKGLKTNYDFGLAFATITFINKELTQSSTEGTQRATDEINPEC